MSRTLLLLVVVSMIAVSTGHAGDGVPKADLAEARALAKDFMTDLKHALIGAIEEGGPAHAIPVCAAAAPGIATRLSQTSGWAVGRTALRVRNPRNAPSPKERAVLMRFSQRAAAGEELAAMEYASVGGEGEGRYLHYMKAIPMGEVCATCHGSNVDPALLQTIRATYPQDAATGFAPGELRGAFTFVKPLGGE